MLARGKAVEGVMRRHEAKVGLYSSEEMKLRNGKVFTFLCLVPMTRERNVSVDWDCREHITRGCFQMFIFRLYREPREAWERLGP